MKQRQDAANLDVAVGEGAHLGGSTAGEGDDLDADASALGLLDDAGKVGIAGDDGHDLQAVDHANHVDGHLDIEVALDGAVREALQWLGDDAVLVWDERRDEALLLHFFKKLVFQYSLILIIII